MRRQPGLAERVAGVVQFPHDFLEVLSHEVRQQEPVVQRGAPTDQRFVVRLVPEPRDERSHQQLLGEAHPRVGRHLESAELDQAQPAAGRIRRVQLVDAELRAMRVARHVHQQVPEDAVHQPRRTGLAFRQLAEREFQFVQALVPRLVHARRLARRTDEQPGQQVRQRGPIVPVGQQAPQQVGPPQEGTVRRRRSAQHQMIPAARPGVPAVQHEFLRAQPRLARLLVQAHRVLDQFVPAGRRMDVDFDHTRVRGHLEILQTMVVRWRIALDHHRHTDRRGRVLNRRDQVQIVLQPADGRHEHV